MHIFTEGTSSEFGEKHANITIPALINGKVVCRSIWMNVDIKYIFVFVFPCLIILKQKLIESKSPISPIKAVNIKLKIMKPNSFISEIVNSFSVSGGM